MRILIPQHYYEDSFVDNVQMTLKEMGHEVCTLGFVDWKEIWSSSKKAIGLVTRALSIDENKRAGQRLLKIAKEFRPDILLSTTGTVNEDTLDELGTFVRGRRILWWGDPPANARRWDLLSPGWDVVYMKDRAAVHKLKLAGQNAHLLHEAMNPNWHKPLAGKRNKAFAIAGNCYAFRQALVRRLMKDGVQFQLFGPPVPSWSYPEIKKAHSGQYLVKEEKSLVFGEAAGCLNTFSFAEGDSLNCRAFEIAGAGGLQLIEHRPAIEDCFVPGKELLTFATYDELVELSRRAVKYPDELDVVRRAGASRALAEHTYRHRLDVILKNF